MDTFLVGKSVSLRTFQKEDYALILKALSNPEIRKMTGAQKMLTPAKIEKAYDAFALDDHRIDLIITKNETEEPIGDLALNEIDYLNRHANVRIALHDPKYFGKGFGTEALRLIMEYGFQHLHLNRIALCVYSYNARGIKAYGKLGFKQEGVIRSELFYDGEFHDNIIMGVLRDEFFEALSELDGERKKTVSSSREA
ncbi:GNAT family protein [Rossellomorea sp. YZS02]|uniref:GNAT family N-acetyltransferase n=1 Tax=Rossellomorea sp. YZS02 TaxID=3097358 RepID=UPI002A1007CC|nr:GNAT family protein [Rossellomorea sp. YZS02]MDX8342594.1 GNAT family protein [Rossellomorea sp. YZS02]